MNAKVLHYYHFWSQKIRHQCGASATTLRGVLEAYSGQKQHFGMVVTNVKGRVSDNVEGKTKSCTVVKTYCTPLGLRFSNH